jgi:dTDP-4-dehydrorhamnose reductase
MSAPVLVTGGTGQVGGALVRRLRAAGIPVVAPARPAFDLARPDRLAATLVGFAPRAVVHCAAWTAVDAAERDETAAHVVNAEAPAAIAAACAAGGIPLVHVSTDYVFDGGAGAPFAEDATPAPLQAYGRSKLAGERAVLASGAEALIVRASAVYDADGRNFLTAILARARRGEPLRVVDDQVTAPTSADAVAAALAVLIGDVVAGGAAFARARADGAIVHVSAAGAVSWHEFAVAALARRARHEPALAATVIARTTTAAWGAPAARPPRALLGGRRLADHFGLILDPWETQLDAVLATLG